MTIEGVERVTSGEERDEEREEERDEEPDAPDDRPSAPQATSQVSQVGSPLIGPLGGSPPLTTRIVTPRLVLRPPRTNDVGEVRRMLRKNQLHLKPWNPAPPPGEDPTSITEVSNSVLRQRRDWKRGSGYVFMVATREKPATFIGKIALNGVMRGAMYGAYLGYWMDEDVQTRGLGTEGIAAVLDFAFEAAGLHRIQAAIMPRNARSLRVIEKLGFRREGYAERYLQIAGRWEDHVIFAKTREEHTFGAFTETR
jgi:ribosomal-protein-alanine N-acetyltransferase